MSELMADDISSAKQLGNENAPPEGQLDRLWSERKIKENYLKVLTCVLFYDTVEVCKDARKQLQV